MEATPLSLGVPVPGGHERRNVHFRNTPIVHIITPQCTPPTNGEVPWQGTGLDPYASNWPPSNTVLRPSLPTSHARIAGPYNRLGEVSDSGGDQNAQPSTVPPRPSWYKRLKAAAKTLKREVLAVYYAMQHPDTPWVSKAIAFLVLAYALSPLDLIPDFIPVLGIVDDMVVLPLLIAAAIALLPKGVMGDARRRAEQEPLRLARNWPMAVIIASLWMACLEWLSYFLVTRYGTPVMRRYLLYGMVGLGVVCAVVFGAWLAGRVRKERKKQLKAKAALARAAAGRKDRSHAVTRSVDGGDADVEAGPAAAAAEGVEAAPGGEVGAASGAIQDPPTLVPPAVMATAAVRSKAGGGGDYDCADELRMPLLQASEAEFA